MSTSADITTNGNGRADHEHILRPRAVKPGNPGVLRAQTEEGLLAVALENGNISGQTRYGYLRPFYEHALTLSVVVQHQFLKMRHHQHIHSPRRANS
jgi:hypothetical protein